MGLSAEVVMIEIYESLAYYVFVLEPEVLEIPLLHSHKIVC